MSVLHLDSRPDWTPPPATERLVPMTSIVPSMTSRWYLLVVGLLWGVAAGLALGTLVPTTYSATAAVRLGSGLVPVGQMSAPTSWADDQVGLATTRSTLTAIAEELGEEGPDVVAQRLTVTARENTSFVDFGYSADSAALAEAGADTAARIYLEVAERDARANWQAQIDVVQKLILTAPEWEVPELRRQRQALNRTVVDPGEVAEGAAGQAEQGGVNRAAFPVAGGLGGLLLAAALAYLLEARSPRVRPGLPLPAGLRDLGRLDSSGAGMMATVGLLESFPLPEGRNRHRLGAAMLFRHNEELLQQIRGAMAGASSGSEIQVVPFDCRLTDGLQTARSCDGALLVAATGRTTLAQVEEAGARLELLGVPCLGVVTVPRRAATRR
ncbi:hypothetical protein [Nocardioides pacificus]